MQQPTPQSPQQEFAPPLDYGIPGLSSSGVVCPKCGGPQARQPSFTWWGGLLGPKLLHHVKCLRCGACYNGKTGGSNTKAIIIYNLVALGIVFGATAITAVAVYLMVR